MIYKTPPYYTRAATTCSGISANKTRNKMNPLSQFVVALLVLFPLQAAAYSNGKVEPSCVTMVPNHPYPIQNSSAPYTLTVSNTTYLSGDKITVTLRNTTEEYPIEGFMIQARQQDSNTPLGSFIVSGSEVQTLTCTTAASAVSHTSDVAKSIVQVTWVAPNGNISEIYFRYTVVRNGSTFWTNMVGPRLTYVGSGGSHTTAPLCLTSVSILFSVLLTLSSRF